MSSLDEEVDAARVVAELRDLQARTGDDRGAQRVAWTATWADARAWLSERLADTPGLETHTDAAGNRWITLPGRSERRLLIGGHLDSVPNGGWLDGALGIVAGAEVLRALARRGEPPAVTVALVDWADEEGARFGRSLFGSSATSGTLDPAAVHDLTDADGVALPQALAEHGVDLERALDARRELAGAAAYLELHIEQGPVLERLGLPLAAVVGTTGIRRRVVRFSGQAAHAGTTPMADRRDAFAAAARTALAIRDAARTTEGAVATTGEVRLVPGIATAVAGTCELTVDQRHLDPAVLDRLVAEAEAAATAIAREERVGADWREVWRIEPIAFDPELIDLADAAIAAVAGGSHRMPSGALHDAAEVARAGVPTAMLFVASRRGISHAREEDTAEADLELAVRALARTTGAAMARLAG